MMMDIVSDSDSDSGPERYLYNDSARRELDKKMISYIHLTEVDQFNAKYVKKYSHTNPFFKNYMEGNLVKTIDYIEDVDEEINATDSSSELQNYSPECLWLKITDKLNSFSQRGDIGQTILSYSGLLSAHVRHGVSLNVRCFDALILCQTPRHIQGLFDLNLIEPEDKGYISHLFDTDSKLNDASFVHKLVRSHFFVDIVASLTILFYKCPISKFVLDSDIEHESVISCLLIIAEVINSERYIDHYQRNTLEDAFNRFVKSALLNGLFTNTRLRAFLENNRACPDPHMRIHSSDEDSDRLDDSDDTSMDTNDSDDDVRPRHRLDINNQRNNTQKKSIGERIQFRETLTEPMSLKKLTRIQIKNSMKDYCQKNIRKLDLPQILKDYVGFNEEVNEVLQKTSI